MVKSLTFCEGDTNILGYFTEKSIYLYSCIFHCQSIQAFVSF